MAKNRFTQLTDLPSREELERLVDNMGYIKLEVNKLPDEVKNNGLSGKFNSVILCASGSTESMVYSAVGIRPDKGGVADEHPFVFYYDNNDPSGSFGGIIHHGDWPGRTTSLSQTQIDALDASGLTASFAYKGIPQDSSGSLDDLNRNGMLEGVSKQFQILLDNKNKSND